MKPYQVREHGQYPKFQYFAALEGQNGHFLGIFGPKMAVFWVKNGQIFVKAPGIPPQTLHLCIKTYQAR